MSISGVGVSKCSTGLYLYKPKSDGFGSPPRCRHCRANDDSITQAEPRLYRDNPAEVGGTARSWRPETHVDTRHARAQRLAVDTHARACPVHLFSFFFFFFFRRIRLSALPAYDEKREWRVYTLDVVTREQSDKESPTARTSEKASNAAATTVGHSLRRCRTIVSFPSRIYCPAECFVAGTRETSKLRMGKNVCFSQIFEELETKGKTLLEA